MGETRVDLQHLLPDLAACLTLSKSDFIRTPAYTRATASRSAGYHVALAVALALAPLAVAAAGEHAFITQFLAHWGGAPAHGSTTGNRHRRLA